MCVSATRRCPRLRLPGGSVKCWRGAVAVAVVFQMGCVDILGLREGFLAPERCRDTSECAPKQICERDRCVAESCKSGETRCEGVSIVACGADGRWLAPKACDSMCASGKCQDAPSCSNRLTCAEGVSCCKSLEIGGTFELRYLRSLGSSTHGWDEQRVTRTIRPVALDRFEVTVDRFQLFLAAYEALDELKARVLTQDAGAYAGIPNLGWQSVWNTDSKLLPQSRQKLENVLTTKGQTFDEPELGQMPVRGVNWYLAFAFCIWDGGRLPTEAEWAFAAFGGDQERTYPWQDGEAASVTSDNACYSPDQGHLLTEPGLVGHLPMGRGAFLHDDLAGNVLEWVADSYDEGLAQAPCSVKNADGTDGEDGGCLLMRPGPLRVLRGGSFEDSDFTIRNTYRHSDDGDVASATHGFRCARELQ